MKRGDRNLTEATVERPDADRLAGGDREAIFSDPRLQQLVDEAVELRLRALLDEEHAGVRKQIERAAVRPDRLDSATLGELIALLGHFSRGHKRHTEILFGPPKKRSAKRPDRPVSFFGPRGVVKPLY